jgi:hypothetical protein
MKISTYNATDMSLISSDATGVNFGDGVLGGFCKNAVVFKAVPETEILTSLSLYLEDRADLDHTRFGLYKSQTATTGIQPGNSLLNTYLVESPGVSDQTMFSDNSVDYDTTDPEYTWIDARIGMTETNFGETSVNFRFVFEYN